MVTNKEHHTGLERLAAFAVDGSVVSVTDRPFPLRDTADALGHLAQAAPWERSSSPSDFTHEICHRHR